MLELACLDTSRCKTRGDLVKMMTQSLSMSRPKKVGPNLSNHLSNQQYALSSTKASLCLEDLIGVGVIAQILSVSAL